VRGRWHHVAIPGKRRKRGKRDEEEVDRERQGGVGANSVVQEGEEGVIFTDN